MSPVSDFFERREERLKTINREYRQKSQQDLERLRNRSSNDLALRKVRN
jgi:hypothetical protein